MVNKEQQIKSVFIYLLPVISSILPFISLPIFTRILSKEDYGLLALAQVYAIFICGLANFGTTAAYDRNFPNSGINVRKLLNYYIPLYYL